jgi:hypothetical protein
VSLNVLYLLFYVVNFVIDRPLDNMPFNHLTQRREFTGLHRFSATTAALKNG